MRKFFFFTLLLLFSLFAHPVPSSRAEEGTPVRGKAVVYFENDLFYNTDKYYTNAVQVRYITPPLRGHTKETGLPGALDGLGEESAMPGFVGTTQYNLSFGLGQTIFTPEDTGSSRLQNNDRPYAGHLYAFVALHAKQRMVMDTLELTLGVVGPSAMGELSQNEIHRVRGFDLANGWHHQLKDEPTLMLTWARNYRLNSDAGARGWGWDVLPYHSLTAGNVLTQATVGTEVRFGVNLPRDYTTSTIRPGSGVDAPTDRPEFQRQAEGFGWYFFSGAEGRAVARNIFLDGNTWQNSHSVDKENFVAELNAGVALLYGGMRLSYNHVYITKEFKNQKGGGQNYGSITLAIPF